MVAFYVVRHILYSLMNRGPGYQPFENAPMRLHLLYTFVPFLLILIVGLFVTDLGIVMSISGLLAAVIIAFVLPALCYLKVCGYKVRFWREPRGLRCKALKETWVAVFLVVFGCLCCTIGTVYTIVDYI